MSWIRIARSGIAAIHYDEPNQRLIVHWERSGYYVFGNVALVEAQNMASAPNPSAYFKRHIEPHAVRLPDNSADDLLKLVRPAGR